MIIYGQGGRPTTPLQHRLFGNCRENGDWSKLLYTFVVTELPTG
jgi:hypothetical protein